ncbi:metallophosphoesterase [Candidatus Woesearchaeota archaeon]|nr:metallophosphoesterase [Candidatus Woesearchaeota archaeon]
MKIGVISDTHDQQKMIIETIRIFNIEKADLVIHCGDWVSPFSAARFRDLNCSIKGIFGNNDGDKKAHRERNKFIEYHDEKMELEIGGRKVFVVHGDDGKVVHDAISSGKYDAVFSGHTHVPHVKKMGDTLWVNPGSLVDGTYDEVSGMSIAFYSTGDNSAIIQRLGGG